MLAWERAHAQTFDVRRYWGSVPVFALHLCIRSKHALPCTSPPIKILGSVSCIEEVVKKGQKKIKLAKSIPLKRIGSSDEVADLIFFLSSDEAKYITGQTINIDGGNYFN